MRCNGEVDNPPPPICRDVLMVRLRTLIAARNKTFLAVSLLRDSGTDGAGISGPHGQRVGMIQDYLHEKDTECPPDLLMHNCSICEWLKLQKRFVSKEAFGPNVEFPKLRNPERELSHQCRWASQQCWLFLNGFPKPGFYSGYQYCWVVDVNMRSLVAEVVFFWQELCVFKHAKKECLLTVEKAWSRTHAVCIASFDVWQSTPVHFNSRILYLSVKGQFEARKFADKVHINSSFTHTGRIVQMK